MVRISEAIEVDASIERVFEAWASVDGYPRFMAGVERVVRLDERTLDWTATVDGWTRSWRSEIVAEQPNRHIAWQSLDGRRHDGRVTLGAGRGGRTRIVYELDTEVDGLHRAGRDTAEVVRATMRGDLERLARLLVPEAAAAG